MLNLMIVFTFSVLNWKLGKIVIITPNMDTKGPLTKKWLWFYFKVKSHILKPHFLKKPLLERIN